jgi:hypothetical protein
MLFPAIFAIVIGVGMLGQWSFFYLSRQIPEIDEEPLRIGFHLAGEGITALALIVGGAGLLLEAGWARDLSLVALGMLFYTAIVSPGYFAQKGHWAWLGFFGLILALGVVSVLILS